MTMALLEQLLMISRDAGSWIQYNDDALVDLWLKKCRACFLRAPRKGKVIKTKRNLTRTVGKMKRQ